MKVCPFCAESIQDAAIKCRFCGERLGPGGAVTPLPSDDELISQSYRVGNFNLVAHLGAGGMGSVFVGEHPDIGKRVAIKIMRHDLTANQEAVERFLTEAKTVVRLRHPSIVDVLDYGVLDSGQRYLVMEYLDGEDLKLYRRNRGRLSPHEAGGIVWQILDALAAAHTTGVVHRDIKPENVFVIPWGRRSLVKLLDFGIAKLLGDAERDGRQTQTGVILGTPAYMAPEQAAGRRDLDGRTDIYSVGIILYELVVGRRPFQSPNPGELLLMQQSSPPPPPRLYVPNIPPLLEQLILCCLEKDPDRRPQSASELRDELQGLFPTLPRQPLASSDDDAPGEGGATLVDLAELGGGNASPKAESSTRTPPPAKPPSGKMPATAKPPSVKQPSVSVPPPPTPPRTPSNPPPPRAPGSSPPEPSKPSAREGLTRPVASAGSIQLRISDIESTTLSQSQGEINKILLPPEAPPPRRRWLVPAFAGLVGVGALSLVFLLSGSSGDPASSGLGVSVGQAPWGRIVIDTAPIKAEIFDPNQTVPLGTAPFDAEVPPQGRQVILRAPGFVDRELTLRPSDHSPLLIQLTPLSQ